MEPKKLGSVEHRFGGVDDLLHAGQESFHEGGCIGQRCILGSNAVNGCIEEIESPALNDVANF